MKRVFYVLAILICGVGPAVSGVFMLTKLGELGDGDPLLTPLRMLARSIILLGIGILTIGLSRKHD